MKLILRALPLLVTLLAACTAVLDSETQPVGENVLSAEQLRAAKEGPVDFATHVKPILETKCSFCHLHASLPGHMSLENRREAVRTGTLGTFIVPGHPEKSLFITNVRSGHRSIGVMPAVGNRLTDAEVELLKKWITEGANWPSGAAGTLRQMR